MAARKTGNVSFITAATTTPDRNVDHADDSGHTTEGNQSEVTPEHQEASESGHNPASTKATQDHAEKLRSEIEAHLTDQQIDAIRAQVQAKPLEALAQEILSTL